MELTCPRCGCHTQLLCDAVVRRRPLARIDWSEDWYEPEIDKQGDVEIDQESEAFEGNVFYRCNDCGLMPAENDEMFPSDDFFAKWVKQHSTTKR